MLEFVCEGCYKMNENKNANNNIMLGALTITSNTILACSCIGSAMTNSQVPDDVRILGLFSVIGLAVGVKMVSLGASQKLVLRREKAPSRIESPFQKIKRR